MRSASPPTVDGFPYASAPVTASETTCATGTTSWIRCTAESVLTGAAITVTGVGKLPSLTVTASRYSSSTLYSPTLTICVSWTVLDSGTVIPLAFLYSASTRVPVVGGSAATASEVPVPLPEKGPMGA